MPTSETSNEQPAALVSALAEWLSAHAEGQALLARWRADPGSLAVQLEHWLDANKAAAPPSLATYLSGSSSVKELVNIAHADQINLHLVAAPPERPKRPPAWFEPALVSIAEGPFLMGSAGGVGIAQYEQPQCELHLAAFRIGRSAVTNDQYLEFVRAGGSVWKEMDWRLADVGYTPPAGKGDHPVVGVSWDDAVAYCRWLASQTGREYRLPTEAEWEKAARGTDGRAFPWGQQWQSERCNSLEAGVGDTTSVGAYAAGSSVYGCDDMAGNVWEWTSTCWGIDRPRSDFPLPYRADDGREDVRSARPYRELRICRGGSFREPALRVACTARGRQAADEREPWRGFRVALDEA